MGKAGHVPGRVMRWAVLALAVGLGAQTRVEPKHVRRWPQLCHTGGAGTCYPVAQLALDASVRGLWEKAAWAPAYDQYRVAVVTTQRLPILITCGRAGQGCANWFPLWFNSKERGPLAKR